VQPRDLSLVIKGQGPFDVTLVDTGVATATLNLTLTELDRHIAALRQTLHEIVFFPYGCSDCYVYQQQVQIPEEVHKEALKKLATAGWLLFRRHLLQPGQRRRRPPHRRPAARAGAAAYPQDPDRLRPLPPALGRLYLENPTTMDEIDPGAFLGFRHILEQIPLQQNVTVLEPNILSEPELAVSVNFNADIDAEMSLGVIAEQQATGRSWGGPEPPLPSPTDADTLLQRLAAGVRRRPDPLLLLPCRRRAPRPGAEQRLPRPRRRAPDYPRRPAS
jgi:hypothetical protein